jgi:integrase
MASISRDKDGRCTIQFYGGDGRRRTIRLGKLSRKDADKFRFRVEALLASRLANLSVDNETAGWLGGLSDRTAARLAAAGLIPRRAAVETPTLAKFIADFVAGHQGAKKMSRVNLDLAGKRLVRFFGAGRRLGEITPGEADQFAAWLRGQGYAQATASRTVNYAKQFFRAAQRRRVIPENPFADLKCGSQTNERRKVFVTRETTEKVLAACPDHEWQLIVALARYGGLRTPSETLKLEWADVLWDRDRMRVTAPKTEHHEGKGERWVPIFPELRPFLDKAWDEAPEGAVYVISRTRDPKVNWRTQLLKIIRRAGLTPWTKPFQNMRATRETELADQFPAHVVSAWIGNSERVAADHYLQVTEGHMQCAAKSGAASSHKGPGGESHRDTTPGGETAKSPVFYESFGHDEHKDSQNQYAWLDSNQQPSVP